MRWRRPTGWLAACAAALLGVCLPSSGSTAVEVKSDYVDCRFDKKKHRLSVHVKDEGGGIIRQGRRIRVRGEGSADECNGATIGNTDRIRFVLGSIGITTGRIALDRGALAPGRSPEPESPEIEMTLRLAGYSPEPQFVGTTGPDPIRGGSLAQGQGLNLNFAAEPLQPDVDVSLLGAETRHLFFNLGAGSDQLLLGGGPEYSGPLTVESILTFLGDGDDSYVGTAGVDFVLAGSGGDAISTGAGDDAINSEDLVPELVDCGAGADVIQPDSVDVLLGCETIDFVGVSTDH